MSMPHSDLRYGPKLRNPVSEPASSSLRFPRSFQSTFPCQTTPLFSFPYFPLVRTRAHLEEEGVVRKPVGIVNSSQRRRMGESYGQGLDRGVVSRQNMAEVLVVKTLELALS